MGTDPTNALTRFACVKQCNSEEGCTHMEWGLNGNGEKQCVIFCPQCDPSMVPTGWAFVPGNGGTAITQGCAGRVLVPKEYQSEDLLQGPHLAATISPATGGMRPSAAV